VEIRLLQVSTTRFGAWGVVVLAGVGYKADAGVTRDSRARQELLQGWQGVVVSAKRDYKAEGWGMWWVGGKGESEGWSAAGGLQLWGLFSASVNYNAGPGIIIAA